MCKAVNNFEKIGKMNVQERRATIKEVRWKMRTKSRLRHSTLGARTASFQRLFLSQGTVLGTYSLWAISLIDYWCRTDIYIYII